MSQPWDITPSSEFAAALDRGLVFLDRVLPDPLRVPVPPPAAVVVVVGARDRDALIRRLAGEGAATQWIAREVGLSVSQVNRILARRERAA